MEKAEVQWWCAHTQVWTLIHARWLSQLYPLWRYR